MKKTEENNDNDKAKASLSGLEPLFIILLLMLSGLLAYYAVAQFRHGQPFDGIEMMGFTLIVLSGCRDPINSIWFFLPFGFRPIAKDWVCLA